jgi:putative hemolysin
MTETLIIFLLILLNGFFALAEMAVISARKPRLQQRADEGDPGASAALDLANEPGNFLSTVQIGITLIGVLAGAFGGATIATQLAESLSQIPALAPYAGAISVGLVVLVITYLTLVLGELAPKRFALSKPARVASRIARPMRVLTRILSPLARFLSLSAESVLRILGQKPSEAPPVTEEEIRIMLEEGAALGVFEPAEEEMVDRVFRLSHRRVSALLSPRTTVDWIDVDDSEEEIQRKITISGHSRFPVAEGNLDNVLGVVLAQDLLAQSLAGQPIDVRSALRPAPFVPEGMPALDVLEHFRAANTKIALVLDEYGGFQGLVTGDDLLEAIVGDIPGLGEAPLPEAFQRADGSWLLDGLLPLDEFDELFEGESLPARGIDTVGGLVMFLLGRIPAAGDRLHWQGLALEVMDMDGRRVDKVLVTLPRATSPDESAHG